MIIQESSINRFNNVLDNLPVLYDLGDPRLVTIIETDQGNIIRFTDLYNYAQKSGISFNEAFNHIENNSNLFELQIAIDEALIYDYPNLLNEFPNLIIMPQSKNSLAYKFCEVCLNAYLETGDKGYVNYFLEGEVAEAQNTTGETTSGQQVNQQEKKQDEQNTQQTENQPKPAGTAGTEASPDTTEKKPSWLSQKWAALKQWAAEHGIKDIGTFLQYLKGKMFGGDVPNSQNPNNIKKSPTQEEINEKDKHSTTNVLKAANGTDNSGTNGQTQAGQSNTTNGTNNSGTNGQTQTGQSNTTNGTNNSGTNGQTQAGQSGTTNESFNLNEMLGTTPVRRKPVPHPICTRIGPREKNNDKSPLPSQTTSPIESRPFNDPNTIDYSTTKPQILKPRISKNGQNCPQGMKEDIDLFINEVYRPRRLYRHRYLR